MTGLADRLVIDASVAVKWVVGEPDSDRALSLRGRRFFAPDLLSAECANVLWKKIQRGELSAEEAVTAALLLEAAEVELVATRPFLATAVGIAASLEHSAYDCMYLAVAEALDAPLVTAADRLVQVTRTDPSARFRDRVIALRTVPLETSPS